MLFAAAVLVTVGLFQVLPGIAALAEDEFFVRGSEYVYKFDLTTWGWVHLLIGVCLGAIGVFLFTGATWACWAGYRGCGSLRGRQLHVAALLPVLDAGPDRAERCGHLGSLRRRGPYCRLVRWVVSSNHTVLPGVATSSSIPQSWAMLCTSRIPRPFELIDPVGSRTGNSSASSCTATWIRSFSSSYPQLDGADPMRHGIGDQLTGQETRIADDWVMDAPPFEKSH
jgi:hypothetical protein